MYEEPAERAAVGERRGEMIASFDQKPESGGMPISASAPTGTRAWVYGMHLAQAAHLADVLLAAEVVDDHARRRGRAAP